MNEISELKSKVLHLYKDTLEMKAKYIWRTGSPGNYKYEYADGSSKGGSSSKKDNMSQDEKRNAIKEMMQKEKKVSNNKKKSDSKLGEEGTITTQDGQKLKFRKYSDGGVKLEGGDYWDFFDNEKEALESVKKISGDKFKIENIE